MSTDGGIPPTQDPAGDTPLAPGSAVGPYEIVGLLARGGMGDVYRATDSRLRRDVAVKILGHTGADEAGRQRFVQEARVTASLDHSNVVKVYDVGIDADRPYLVQELLQGETLRARISRGPLPIADVRRIAIEVARGLGAAHTAGLVHRDLKPENVFVTRSGVIKVLDFGIAKLTQPDAPSDALATATGVLVGTPGYLAPEQIRGEAVDSRTDLFALGLILQEMLTGERPFARGNTVETLNAILNDPAPDLLERRSDLSPGLAAIVTRLLEKAPEARFHSAADLAWALDQIDEPAADRTRSRDTRPRSLIARLGRHPITLAAAFVLAVIAAAALLSRPRPETPSAEMFSVLLPEGTTLTEGEAPQVSPDGRTIALVGTDASGRTLLYLRERSSLTARVLPGTDDASLPFWSPDSRSVGFFARGMLRRIEASGGSPQPLARAPVPRGGAWNRDGVILFVPFPEEPLHSIPAGGGKPTPLAVDPPGETRWFPSFLPDGRHYVYFSWQKRIVSVASLDSNESKELLHSISPAVYVEPGFLVFRREESLVAQRFRPDTLQLEGSAVVLADKVRSNPITAQMMFSASGGGVLAYVGAGQGWQLAWVDRLGKRLGTAGVIGGHNSLCLSADGKRVVFDAADSRSGAVDIWSLNVSDGASSRLTFHPAADFYAVCAPSGDEVIFASPRSGTPRLFRLSASAPGGERELTAGTQPSLPTDWSRDNRFLVYSAFSGATNWDIWVLPLGGGPPIAFAATEAEERSGHLSPDSRWMAYSSDLDGTFEVYVQPFPVTGSRWQISRGGGRQPLWSADGKQLYYISLDNKLIAVDVQASESRFELGASRVLIDTRVGGWERTHQGTPYAATSDGGRILIANAQDAVTPVTIVLHWQSMMGR